MAELFHEPVPRFQPSQGAIPDHLPAVSGLVTHESALLHLNQLETAFTDLLGDQGATAAAVAAVHQVFEASPIRGDKGGSAVAEPHRTALTSLTVADFRLGKAYGLGRALAETVLLPLGAEDDACPSQYRVKFGTGRLGNLYQW